MTVPQRSVLIALSLVLIAAFAACGGGLQFTELMSGYFVDGNVPFEQAYSEGKAKNQTMYFTLTAIIPELHKFISDVNHTTHITNGTLHVLQDQYKIEDWSSTLTLFDHGITPPLYVLYLKYNLKFKNTKDGQLYHLEGIKEIYGNSCVHILEMFTTLYVHIRKGWEAGSGEIVQTAILKIDPTHVVTWLLSFRGYKANFLEFVVNFEKFSAFMLRNVKDDCTNFTALFETQFWYTWGSNGKQGFLIDLVRRPTNAEVRLDLYNAASTSQQVLKQFYDLQSSKFSNTAAAIGDFVISETGVKGTIDNVSVEANYNLNPKQVMDFVPNWIDNFSRFIPRIQSVYGELDSATVDGVQYAKNSPIVYTRYTIPIGITAMKWSMISAHQFNVSTVSSGNQLRIESMFAQLDNSWVGSVYVQYNGKQYQFNNPLLLQSKLTSSGTTVNAKTNKREFSIDISAILQVHLVVSCSADDTQFAILEQEGDTKIHTTVLGQCIVRDTKSNQVYVSNGALLEVKY